MDESGIDAYIYREYGRSPRGVPLIGEISGKRFARESFVAAKCGSTVLAPMCFQGTCNTLLFESWIEQCLAPVLQPGQVVIMDNASFHKSQKSKELIESVGASILFLPPYSPDLNPIEIFWANLKKKVRCCLEKFKHLSTAIDLAFQESMREGKL